MSILAQFDETYCRTCGKSIDAQSRAIWFTRVDRGNGVETVPVDSSAPGWRPAIGIFGVCHECMKLSADAKAVLAKVANMRDAERARELEDQLRAVKAEKEERVTEFARVAEETAKLRAKLNEERERADHEVVSRRAIIDQNIAEANARAAATLSAVQSQLEESIAEINRLSAANLELQSQNSALKVAIRDLSASLEKATSDGVASMQSWQVSTREEIDALRSRIADLQNVVAETRDNLQAARSYADSLESRNATQAETIRSVVDELRSAKAEIDRLRAAQESAEANKPEGEDAAKRKFAEDLTAALKSALEKAGVNLSE